VHLQKINVWKEIPIFRSWKLWFVNLSC